MVVLHPDEEPGDRVTSEVPGLRDAIARALLNRANVFADYGWDVMMEEAKAPFREDADVALATLCQSLREHPEWIADLVPEKMIWGALATDDIARGDTVQAISIRNIDGSRHCYVQKVEFVAPPTTEGAEK